MNSAPDRYTLFVSDLFLYHGGVSDYTDHFAQQLFRLNRLKTVVTPYATKITRDYPITVFGIKPDRKPGSLDKWAISSKIRTLFFYSRLYVSAWRELKKLNLKNDDCIIFTEYYTIPFDIIIYCARFLKIKYTLVFHGLDLISVNNKRFTHFPENFRKAEFIIFNSEATRSLAQEMMGIKHKHNLVLYPGIDVNELENPVAREDKFQIPSVQHGELIFSTVSRLVKRKGIDIAIRIVYELAKSGKDLRYYIGGTGVEEGRLKALVKELDAEKYIYFLGEIEHTEKYKLLEVSDFILTPNHSAINSDFEGFGISCIEASFFGNVIIAGNHGGVKEAVLDGETGFLFDFDNKESIGRAVMIIRNCIENPQLREHITKRGIEYVRSTYDWDKLIHRFVQAEQAFYAAQYL